MDFESQEISPKIEDHEIKINDRFSIITNEQLGIGGGGSVYNGYDSNLDRMVAIKLVEVVDPKSYEDAVKEAKITANVNNPHVIEIDDVVDYVTSDNEGNEIKYVALVLRKQNSSDNLRKRMEAEEDVPLEGVVALTEQISEAIDEMGEKDLRSRDIKPSNLFLRETKIDENTTQWYAVMIDLGINNQITGSEEGLFTATMKYAAPETFNNIPEDESVATEVYTLAASVYALMTKKDFREGKNEAQLMMQALMDETLNSDQEENLRNSTAFTQVKDKEKFIRVMKKALMQNPEDRYQAAKEFAKDLKEASGF